MCTIRGVKLWPTPVGTLAPFILATRARSEKTSTTSGSSAVFRPGTSHIVFLLTGYIKRPLLLRTSKWRDKSSEAGISPGFGELELDFRWVSRKPADVRTLWISRML